MPLTDLSNLKAPGWSRVVGELSAPAGDDRVFLLRLIGVLGQVSGARQGVLYTLAGLREPSPEVEPRATLIWPLPTEAFDQQGRMTVPLDAMFDPTRIAEGMIHAEAEVRAAARAAAESRQVSVFGLEGDSLMYDPTGPRGYVVAVPVASGLPHEAPTLPLAGVITLLLDARSRQALQTTVALIEVLAGYSFLHATASALRRTRAASASLELAARLISAINTTASFKGCILQLVNDLSRQLGFDRVALGWVRQFGSAPGARDGRRETRCLAISDTEYVDRRMAMVRRIESAMDECLDQEQPIMYPLPPGIGDPVLTLAVTGAHRELAAADARLRVASIPLRVTDSAGERVIGVLLVESTDEKRLDPATIELLQATLDLVSPVLAVRHSDDRILAVRAWESLKKAGAWAVGPTHTAWKVAGVLVLAASLFLVFYETTYRIGAPMELIPRERRTIAMPFDGIILRVPEGIEPGATVREGQLLVELDTREMHLARLEAEAQIVQSERQADEALKRGESGRAEAAQARAKADQARARRDLLTRQIERSRIVAPMDATIISGDLRDKVGAAVKLGDRLMELARTDDMLVVARVDDRDIALIGIGTTGEISPKSNPSLTLPVTVETIVPLAKAHEGENVFEVRASLPPGTLPRWAMPGMEGQARFNTERHSLAWIASRRIVDTLRVWLWW
jgi:multidrug efflux pump subunit AcrA (membrane-fusion protein)